MVKGKQGLYLEAWKFGVYLGIPIIASVYFSDPDAQRYWADYWQYIKYPENPNTNVKEKIQELAKEKERQREQRLAFKEQLQSLNAAAERSRRYVDDQPIEQQEGLSWWRKAGRWIVGKNDSE